jgi:hypothetical protein
MSAEVSLEALMVLSREEVPARPDLRVQRAALADSDSR